MNRFDSRKGGASLSVGQRRDAYTHDSDIITIPAGGGGQQYLISFSEYPDHQAWNILDCVTEAAGKLACKHNYYTIDNQYIPR